MKIKRKIITDTKDLRGGHIYEITLRSGITGLILVCNGCDYISTLVDFDFCAVSLVTGEFMPLLWDDIRAMREIDCELVEV